MQKIKAWIKRYLPAEIAATLTAIIAGYLSNAVVKNDVITAFVATWGENIGYYGYIIISDITKSLAEHKNNQIKYTILSFSKDIRNIIVEFGPAEFFDSFVIRPFAMLTFTKITGNVIAGIFIGKIAADVIFYFFAIIMFELRKKVFK